MKTLLATKEVAALMNVTETTIKRWADAGELDCVKTLGGHRKFAMQEVIEFARQHSYPITGVLSPEMAQGDREVLEFSLQMKNYHKISQILLDEALHGERKRVMELLIYVLKHGISMSTIGDEIIRPAMVEIGEMWASGKLKINEEHIASHALLEAIILLSPELYRKPPNGLLAICACAEEEYHEIGLRILAYVLESEGWTVHYIGANTPFDTIRELFKTMKPDLVCLSYTRKSPAEHFIGKIKSLGTLVHSHKSSFVVGGFFAGNHAPKDFHCDHIATSAHDTVSFLRDRFRLKPGPKAPVKQSVS
jgi:MerR family transcriptional regulator, light-induced transcriptional regulator